MDVMRAWLRRSLGAALSIPIGIVLAAGLVAAVGGGLGGLSSLSQIAAGPALPGAGTAIDSNPALADSGLAASPATGGAGSSAAAGAPDAAGGGRLSSASGGGSGAGAVGDGGGGGGGAPTGDGSPPVGGDPQNPADGGGSVTGPGASPPENPLSGEVEDITSGLDEALPRPLAPATDGLLDVLAPNR
jgi:hypothetical protein